jgi:hypothetical protein
MKMIIRLSTALVGCFLLLAATANAQMPAVTPVPGTATQNPETGHFYQVFGRASGAQVITWTEASNYTATLPWYEPDGTTCIDGVDCSVFAVEPHLVTITTARENAWVNDLGQSELDAGALTPSGRSQVWTGGLQLASGAEPGGGWVWREDPSVMNSKSEGSIPGTNDDVVYANWHPAEPNNSGGNEEHLTLGRYGFGGGWNDELQTRDSMGGFIVEWDLPREAGTCSEPGGCTTVEGQTLEYNVDATVNFNSFEFLDPRVAAGTCGTAPLMIFGNTGYGPSNRPATTIPAYLCGSPRFVVVAVDATDEFGNELFLDSGTIGVIHDTATILPGNVYPDGGASVCEDPIPFTQFTDGDPQYQDVVGWSTTDPNRMRERYSGLATGIFVGDIGEFTSECGTSRARVKGASNFFAGLRIDFGTGNEYAPGTYLDNFNRFVELGSYQLQLLKHSVQESIDVGAILKNGDEKKMLNMVDNAIKNYEAGNYLGALDHLENFNKFVVPARYDSGMEIDNYEGEHTMRGTNLEFLVRVKIIPYDPTP